MSRLEEFEEARPLLFSIAHRMLGSASRAEDAVHQAWLRYEAAPEQTASGRRFLVATVARICLDAQRGTRPRPVEPAEAQAAAALSLLERLNPLERAVFVLREVLGCGTAQIAAAVGCSEAACRRITAALSTAPDGTGAAPPWPRRIAGAEHVARVLATIVPALVRVGVTLEPQDVDHRPGAVFRDRNGTVLSALALDVLDGRIHTIRWVKDPGPAPADAPAPT
ncbi:MULTISPECIES: sigma factor-like helix-turn-helix DNA-binding protein [unclassified Streptomyces]|uniref:sigma factor-like helix-turn-helix DNA-binding protein n=1 Tax=unclassified Streptomyces TaxID=2593676 RepID=UPI0036E6545F